MNETGFWIGLQVLAFVAILSLGACADVSRSQESIDAEWQERNVHIQLRIVPGFQEVWYKEHLYVWYSSNAARQAGLAHAGHCPGYHPVERRVKR